MTTSHPRLPRLAPLLAVLVAALLVPSAAMAISFTKPTRLPQSPPGGDLAGPEPSVAFDPGGRWTYASAPGGGENGGVAFWRSDDGGKTWKGKSMASKLGGGDSDVSVATNHTVFVADLELIANALCRSTDHGAHFDAGCDTGIASDQEGFDSDREWVTPVPGHPQDVYFTYHDLAAEIPLVYVSHSGGEPYSFTPCGPVLAPGGDPFLNFIPGGTDVGKPTVFSDGSIYVPITEPVNPATPLDPYNAFYVAYAKGGCGLSTVFTNKTIWSNPGADLANIFSYIVHDPAGNLFALADGKTGTDGNHYGAYVWISRDGGKDWSKPVRVDPQSNNAASLAAIDAGPKAGEMAVGYYGTRTTNDPNSDKNVWQYFVAETSDFGKHWSRTQVSLDPLHYGQICNKGILCTSGRNLADFSSIAVNPRTGCAIVAIPGDPYDRQNPDTTSPAAYIARQKAGCF
jgi:hypothetical protein